MLSSIRKIKGGGSRGERDSRVFTRVHNWYIVCSIYERGGGGGGRLVTNASSRNHRSWRNECRRAMERRAKGLIFALHQDYFLLLFFAGGGGGREEIDTRGRELRALRFVRQNSICWRKRTQRWPIILNFRYIFDSRAILTKVLI